MRFAVACAAISATLAFSAQAAPISLTFKLDSYANNGPAKPLPWASVDFQVTDPTFSTHAGSGTVAGLLSGINTTTNQRYYVFCSELNQDISIGTTYNFTQYQSYVDAPIQDGRPMGQGKLLNPHEKQLVAGVVRSLGFTGDIMGFVSSTGQDLIGIPASASDVAHIASVTNDEAAAAQIAIWTLVHGLDKARNAVHLNSSTFKVTRINGQPVTSSFEQKFEQTVDYTFSAVPEPSLLLALAAVTVPALALRPTNKRNPGRSPAA